MTKSPAGWLLSNWDQLHGTKSPVGWLLGNWNQRHGSNTPIEYRLWYYLYLFSTYFSIFDWVSWALSYNYVGSLSLGRRFKRLKRYAQNGSTWSTRIIGSCATCWSTLRSGAKLSSSTCWRDTVAHSLLILMRWQVTLCSMLLVTEILLCCFREYNQRVTTLKF